MKILSIHDGYNASVAYFNKNKIDYALQEERLIKIKNFIGFPVNATKKIISLYDLAPEDIDIVVLCGNHVFKPFDVKNIKKEFKKSQQKNLGSVLRKMARNTPIYDYYKVSRKNERLRPLLKLGFKEKQIRFIEHHMAHASSAYFGSNWWNNKEKILILTLDGGGDGLCATVSIGNGGKIKRISETKDANSLGNIYSRVTFMLGFTPWEHEYKLMGMAPYVNKEYSETAYKIFNNYIGLDKKEKLKFIKNTKEPTSLIYNRLRTDLEFQRFDTICRGLQDFTEDLIVKWVKAAIKKTNIRKLALAGGVFMNVKANQRIMELPEVDDLFIFPSCGDETNVFGGAWYTYVSEMMKTKEKIDLRSFGPFYYGTDITDKMAEKSIKKYSKKHNIEFEQRNDISKYVGELIAKNEIVARATGPMEFGARALGNRSILSNASDLKNVQIINMMVKKRDFWMPFAPVILNKRENQYVENPKGISAPYMILTFNTLKKTRDDIVGAVQQADFTARPQIIQKRWNPDYYQTVKTVEKETGFGGLMNTSFNLHGFPIVNDADDALWVFENSGLKYVQIGSYIVNKI